MNDPSKLTPNHVTAIILARLICAAITTRIGPRTWTSKDAEHYAFLPDEEAILARGGSVTIVGPIHTIDPLALTRIVSETALEGHETCIVHLLEEPYSCLDPFYELVALYGQHITEPGMVGPHGGRAIQ